MTTQTRPRVMLDIDGVLVNLASLRAGRSGLHASPDPACVAAFNHVIAETGAVIVVSSTWRLRGLTEMRKILRSWGVTARVVGMTPHPVIEGSSLSRGREIRTWLEAHPDVQRVVVLDDDPRDDGLTPMWVLTDPDIGLTMDDARKAVAILTGPAIPIPAIPVPSIGEYPYVWRVRTRHPDRHGQPCRLMVRGGRNSAAIEFADGFVTITSRNYIRKRTRQEEAE